MIEADEQVAEILADSVAEVADIRAVQIDSTPELGRRESARHLHEVVSRNGTLLILLDSARLLARQEWDRGAIL